MTSQGEARRGAADAGPRQPMGRPTILTPAVHAAIVAELERGTTLELAAECNGVRRPTVYLWMSRGQAGEQPYLDFLDAVTRARAKAQADSLAEIRAAVTAGQNPVPDWKARAEHLRFVNGRDFGVKVEVTQRVEAGLSRVVTALREKLDPGTFERVCEIISEALGDDGVGDAAEEPERRSTH